MIKREFIGEDCPVCGSRIIVHTEVIEDNLFRDGDYATCIENCGFESCISVDEDGEAWVQDGNKYEL